MHECLGISEILRLIFEAAYNDNPHCESRDTLLSLAITCRAFQDVALDIIWHTQDTLVPLIKCMPADLWAETPSTGFDRSLVSHLLAGLFKRSLLMERPIDLDTPTALHRFK